MCLGADRSSVNSYSTDSNHIIRSLSGDSGSISVTRENEEAAQGCRDFDGLSKEVRDDDAPVLVLQGIHEPRFQDAS